MGLVISWSILNRGVQFLGEAGCIGQDFPIRQSLRQALGFCVYLPLPIVRDPQSLNLKSP